MGQGQEFNFPNPNSEKMKMQNTEIELLSVPRTKKSNTETNQSLLKPLSFVCTSHKTLKPSKGECIL